MKFIVGGRGSGKTTLLLREASEHPGCLVVVPNQMQKRIVQQHARDLGLSVEVVTIDAVERGDLRGRDNITVAVDNAEQIIQRAFGNLRVRAASLDEEA